MIAQFDTFAAASAVVGEGEQVSACFTKDPPHETIYFVVPVNASDDFMRSVTFELREGRPMDAYTRKILRMATA